MSQQQPFNDQIQIACFKTKKENNQPKNVPKEKENVSVSNALTICYYNNHTIAKQTVSMEMSS